MRPRNPIRRSSFSQILLAALGLAIAAAAQAETQPSLRGIPYYRFFSTQDFGSGASSEFVTTAADGTVFYGDRNWIFLYDGASWQRIYQNKETNDKITALHWDDDGHIYAAGYSTFGEFVVGPDNQATFKHLVPQSEIDIGESFNRIQSTPDAIYLTGRRSFAKYDKATGAIDTHVFDTWLTANFWLDGKFHLLTDKNQILRYEYDTFLTPPSTSEENSRNDVTIADIVVKPNGEVIMASERRGLFRYDGENFEKAYPNYHHDSRNLVRDIEFTNDNRLIIASMGGGITVLDETGFTLEELGPETDHRFKSARSVTVDKSGTVWAMFNSSIAKILLDSSLTAIDENIRPSFFYASPHLQGDDLYVRSFYILYKAVFGKNGRITQFENALQDTDLEVWSVAETPERLYINTAERGIFKLEDGKLDFLVESEEFDRLNLSTQNPNYLIGANANSISLYKETSDGLTLLDAVKNTRGFINRMNEDANGHFWLEYGLSAAGRVTIKDEKIQLDIFSKENGLPTNEWMTLWMHQGIALFTYSGGVLQFDPATKNFIPYPILESAGLDPQMRIERAFTDPQGNLWISADNKNLIYWIQEDGSFLRDETSLSEMSEPYFEFVSFLENDEALIMTAFEFFHFKQTENTLAQSATPATTRIIAISDSNEKKLHYTYLGSGDMPPSKALNYNENSLVFTVSNPFTYSTIIPQFQYFLEGFSNQSAQADTLQWSSNSTANFTNLNPGPYTFKARTRLGNGYITPWTEYSFSIAPPLYQTVYAYALYTLVFTGLILGALKLNSTRLRKQNVWLETMVANRTKEIEAKNEELEQQADALESKNIEMAAQSEEIQRNAADLANALAQLQETQDQLVTTARIAGRAEVATNVLHNVGNVLNSVNVGLNSLEKQVGKSRIRNLKRITELVHQNRDSLAHFLLNDERGKRIPEYLDQLSEALLEELKFYETEIQQIEGNVDHIKRIIATQQTHAKKIGVQQHVNLAELIESALVITLGDAYQATYHTDIDLTPGLSLQTDKHLVLDILINLIKNAKESIELQQPDSRHLAVACKRNSKGCIEISITDNGSGVAPENQDKLFSHGFTTKKHGHGFGLHSCANAIKSLGGSLKLVNKPTNQGATATLTLPRD